MQHPTAPAVSAPPCEGLFYGIYLSKQLASNPNRIYYLSQEVRQGPSQSLEGMENEHLDQQ
jgi:hypothetical protein